jgi:SRSO17 transposase
MHEHESQWEAEFERWVQPFLAQFGHEGQRRWGPVYLRGLIAPGERKSVEPMARRQCPGNKEQLHHFVATSSWDTCDHERVLLDKADALVPSTRSLFRDPSSASQIETPAKSASAPPSGRSPPLAPSAPPC